MSAKFLNGIDVNNQRVTGVASPQVGSDAVNLDYVATVLDGRSWKQPVRVATTTNGALATAYAAGQQVDGYTLVTGDRILLKDQTTGSENGIYVVQASGAPVRASDADTTSELQNATAYAISGTVNADKSYTQTANDPTVGTTALTWVNVPGSGGTSYTAGTGILISGSTISVNTTVVTRRVELASTAATAGATTSYTHGLGTTYVDIIVFDVASGARVFADAKVIDANTISITSGTAIAAGQYRILIVG